MHRRLRQHRTETLMIALGFLASIAFGWTGLEGQSQTVIPNNSSFRNPGGRAATFSTQGAIDLTSEFFQAQGSNGRSCVTCHLPGEAWSITPATLQRLFDETGGTHPVFNLLDADNPALDVTTVAGRLAAYSMLLSRGVFRRGGTPRTGAEWELVAVDDPHGFAALDRLVHWRRAIRRSTSRSAAPP